MSGRRHVATVNRGYHASDDMVEALASRFVFAPDGCWLWTGYINKHGYGRVWSGGRCYRAHRAMYELMVGPVPVGMEVHHRCLVPRCVNPDHLEAVTSSEHHFRHPRTVELSTHCGQGHERSPENTYIDKNGTRYCRPCQRAGKRRRRAEARRAREPEAVSSLKERD